MNRLALQAELEVTRAAFHTFLNALSADRWHQKSPGSAWRMAEVAVHLTWALEQLPSEVENAKRDRGMFNYPKFIADPGSYWLVRWEARKATREDILARYEAAMDRAVASLQTVGGAQWQRGARFYGEGFYTVADLFHTPAQHLAEHSAPLLGQ